jgi:hypothetical protein
VSLSDPLSLFVDVNTLLDELILVKIVHLFNDLLINDFFHNLFLAFLLIVHLVFCRFPCLYHHSKGLSLLNHILRHL